MRLLGVCVWCLLFECIPTRLQCHCARWRACFPAKKATAGALCPPVTKRLRLLECDQPLACLPNLPAPPRIANPPGPPSLHSLDRRCIWAWSATEKRSAQLEAAASWASPPFSATPHQPSPCSRPLLGTEAAGLCRQTCISQRGPVALRGCCFVSGWSSGSPFDASADRK